MKIISVISQGDRFQEDATLQVSTARSPASEGGGECCRGRDRWGLELHGLG